MQISKALYGALCVALALDSGATENKIGGYMGGSFGYSSVWNLDAGIHLNGKYHAEASAGLFSYSGNPQANMVSIFEKIGKYDLGLAALVNIGFKGKVPNPGITVGYYFLDGGIKLKGEIILAYPLEDKRIQNAINIRIKSHLYDW